MYIMNGQRINGSVGARTAGYMDEKTNVGGKLRWWSVNRCSVWWRHELDGWKKWQVNGWMTGMSFLTWAETCVGGWGRGPCGGIKSNDSCFGLVLFLRQKNKSQCEILKIKSAGDWSYWRHEMTNRICIRSTNYLKLNIWQTSRRITLVMSEAVNFPVCPSPGFICSLLKRSVCGGYSGDLLCIGQQGRIWWLWGRWRKEGVMTFPPKRKNVFGKKKRKLLKIFITRK